MFLGWTIITEETNFGKDPNYYRAFACAGGNSYQQGIVLGNENLSGNSLKGEAKKWSGKYAQSRMALMDAFRANGVIWSEACIRGNATW